MVVGQEGSGSNGVTLQEVTAVVGCEIPRKENSPIFFILFAPPLPVSPGSPVVDATIDKNKRSGYKKKRVDCNF